MSPEVRNALSQAIADGRYIKLTDSINALNDVTISSAAAGHTLYYNAVAGEWQNTSALKNDVASNELSYEGQLIRMDDNHPSAVGNRTWLQIYNRLNQLRFEVSSIANGNPQIRFNVIGNTRIGFPATDPTYFAFINDYTDFWLGNSGDGSLYFNYYNGSDILFGSTLNYCNYTFYINNSMRLNANGSATINIGQNVDLSFATINGSQIGTAQSQRFAFWGASPVQQQVLATGAGATVDNVISLLQTLGLCRQS